MSKIRHGNQGTIRTINFPVATTQGGRYLWSSSIDFGSDFPLHGWLSLSPTVGTPAGTETAQVYIAPVLNGNHVGELSDTASADQATDPDVAYMWHVGEIPTTSTASGEYYSICLTAYRQTVENNITPLFLPKQWQVVMLNDMTGATATIAMTGVFVPLHIRQA